jgi:hypothetical protein
MLLRSIDPARRATCQIPPSPAGAAFRRRLPEGGTLESGLQGNRRRVKMLPMKGKISSAVRSCSHITLKWGDMQTCIITCSVTRNMHNCVLSLSLVAFLSVGCAHHREPASAPAPSAVAETATLRTVAPPAVVTNQLITTFGEHSIGGVWNLQVSREDRTVEVGTTVARSKPSGWRAQDGWFVLVENDRRVWMYDGYRSLLLYEFTRTPTGGGGSWSGPTKFDCPVPEVVLTRLSDAARKAIERND